MIVEKIEQFALTKKEHQKAFFSKIGIVGCGKEGSMIATLAALNDMEVVFMEPTEEKVRNAYARIERRLDARVENWGLTPGEKRAILARIKGTLSYAAFKGCDFVIESIRYDDNTGERSTDLRREVFLNLENVLSKEAIIATNISTPIITELATELEYKERCIGMHVMSHVPDSRILEVVKSLYTSEDVYTKVCHFAHLIKHEVVLVAESAGLVSMRIFFVMLNEACDMLMEGVSTVEDIDKVMRSGFGNRQGVFRTADQMGIEKIVKLMANLYEEFGATKYKPSPILLRLYRAKQFGVSRGRGFYSYDENGEIVK